MSATIDGAEAALLRAFRACDRQGQTQLSYLLDCWPALTADQRASVFRVADELRAGPRAAATPPVPFRIVARSPQQAREAERELVQQFRQLVVDESREDLLYHVNILVKAQKNREYAKLIAARRDDKGGA